MTKKKVDVIILCLDIIDDSFIFGKLMNFESREKGKFTF